MGSRTGLETWGRQSVRSKPSCRWREHNLIEQDGAEEMKNKGVNEKEQVKVISAKISEALYAECEETRDLLRLDTMNELVKRALILFISAHNNAMRSVYQNSGASIKTQFTSDSAETDSMDDIRCV